MKFFGIKLLNVPSDANPEDVAALKAFIEDVYNRGANVGLFTGFGLAIAFIGGGLIAHEVCKRIDKMTENQKTE